GGVKVISSFGAAYRQHLKPPLIPPEPVEHSPVRSSRRDQHPNDNFYTSGRSRTNTDRSAPNFWRFRAQPECLSPAPRPELVEGSRGEAKSKEIEGRPHFRRM